MEENTGSCPVCGTTTPCQVDYERDWVFYRCPTCGKYQLEGLTRERNHFNKNHLAAFLAHNGFNAADKFEHRYYTAASKDICDILQKEGWGRPVHINTEMIEAWYPKSFAEKIDMILWMGKIIQEKKMK